MGIDCMLVLVDGKCYVFFLVGFVVVDINIIFILWIECVEIVIGGVFVVYGVDVVIGVVNFIFKKNIEGFDVSVM